MHDVYQLGSYEHEYEYESIDIFYWPWLNRRNTIALEVLNRKKTPENFPCKIIFFYKMLRGLEFCQTSYFHLHTKIFFQRSYSKNLFSIPCIHWIKIVNWSSRLIFKLKPLSSRAIYLFFVGTSFQLLFLTTKEKRIFLKDVSFVSK